MLRRIVLAAALAACVVAPASAQDEEEAIVVTGSRIAGLGYDSLTLPHITMRRRADSVVVDLVVRNDTRDAAQRLSEMREALRALQGRARAGGVTLALVDPTAGIVRPFRLDIAEAAIRSDQRPDTSTISIHLRTQVSETDTLDSINERVRAFVAAAPRPGRVELLSGAVNLVLNNPEQYHASLVQQITGDGRSIADALGAGYGVTVTGIERQVAWRRTGELELTLFVPYTLSVVPNA
jgi:hypothetical protein